MIEFRPLAKEQLDSLKQENIRTLVDGYARIRKIPPAKILKFWEDQIGKLVDDAWSSKNNVFLAILDAKTQDIVGTLWYRLHEAEPLSDLAFLCWIGIYEKHQRKGYGRAALSCLIEQLRGQGVKRIALEAFAEKSPAMALYESFGFLPVRVILHRFI